MFKQLKMHLNFDCCGKNSQVCKENVIAKSIYILKERQHMTISRSLAQRTNLQNNNYNNKSVVGLFTASNMTLSNPILVKSSNNDNTGNKYKYGIFNKDKHKLDPKKYKPILLNPIGHGSYIFDWIVINFASIFKYFVLSYLIINTLLEIVAIIIDPSPSHIKNNVCTIDNNKYDSRFWYANLFSMLNNVGICFVGAISKATRRWCNLECRTRVSCIHGFCRELLYPYIVFCLMLVSFIIIPIWHFMINFILVKNNNLCWNYLTNHHIMIIISIFCNTIIYSIILTNAIVFIILSYLWSWVLVLVISCYAIFLGSCIEGYAIVDIAFG